MGKEDMVLLERMMRTVVSENNVVLEERIDKRMDGKLEGVEIRMNQNIKEQIETAIIRSESFILDEIERFYTFAKNDIQKLNKKIDEIKIAVGL